MELLRTPSVGLASAVAFWRALFICGSLFMFSYSLAEDCDEIIREIGLSAVQAFLPSKIQIHNQCEDLRNNETDVCSTACNTAIVEFFENNGNDDGRIFFTCVCTEDSDLYPSHECDIDRDRLLACPALAFLLEEDDDEIATTEVSIPTKPPTTTKAAPPTKPIIPPAKDCRRARINCRGSLPCSQAFDYVKDMCLDDFTTDGKCTQECAKAVYFIDMYPSSNDLWGCACDPDSDEVTWCGMYGKNGLRTTCNGIKYQSGKTVHETPPQDDNGAGLQPMANLLMIVCIPFVLVFRIV